MVPDKIQLQLTIKYITLIAGLVLSCLLVLAYLLFAQPNVRIEIIIAIAGSGIALTTLAYAAMNLHFLLETEQQKLAAEKKKVAAQLAAEWNRPNMISLTIVGSEVGKAAKDLPLADFIKLLKDTKKEASIIAILNYFERMELIIQHDMADEGFLKDFFYFSVNGYYHAYHDYINYKRQQMGNQHIFERFEALAKRWSQPPGVN
jgi:hypothetical protein